VPAFADGEVIAKRYLVRRFIARGGMGEVYAVDDLELGIRVALKTILPELAGDDVMRERFRQEIHLARKITHPNVCRLFDLGIHAGQVTFLTMELLEGETLHARIRRAGPLPEAEALPIVEQLAAALSAAHALGVVHRDLKSENVMLVATPSGSVRAVVTDFGLARSTEGHSVVQSGTLVGTAGYIAPEQLDGSGTGPPADLYALGVVLFEMATGRLPFEEENPLATALARLRRRAPSPRRFAHRLDRRWERAILRCLERDPSRRFADSGSLVAALKGRAPPSKWPWAAAALVVAVLSLAGVAWRTHKPSRSRSSRPSVAVLDLANAGGRAESAWLSAALGELVSGELTVGDRLRRVAGESVARAERDLAVKGGALDAASVQRLRALLEADFLVSGSYRSDGDALEVELTLTDARDGRTLAAVSQRGAASHLFELVERLGERLRAPLGMGGVSVADAEATQTSLPRNPEAARLYAEGLTSFRRFDARTARDQLASAAQLEPEFALIHAALADAWGQLGHGPEQRTEAKRAFELAGTLPRAEQLLIEAKYRAAASEWPRAVELYRALCDFYPDSVEYPLALARLQARSGDAPRARETLAQLRRTVPGAADDPRVDYTDGWACENLSDYACERDLEARAIERARALGSRQLVAMASNDRALACSLLGDRACATAAIEESLRIAHELDDKRMIADALYDRGVSNTRGGAPKQALRDYQDAAAIYAELGADNSHANALIGEADVAGEAGQPDVARRAYEEAMPLIIAVDNKRLLAAAHIGLAQQHLAAGRFDEAQREYEASLAIARSVHKVNSEAAALSGLADVEEMRGELAKANELESQALAIVQRLGDKGNIGHAKGRLAGRMRELGDSERAEPLAREAVRELEAVNDKVWVAEAQRELAAVLLTRGRAAEAVETARASIATLGDADPDGVADGQALLARALVRAGKLAEARAAIEPARDNPSLRIQASAALVETAEGHAAAAVKRLAAALARGEPDLATCLDAELVLARAEIAAGNAGGQARLKRATADARAHGLVALLAP
jgi:tetratricopeptide (TPR) repeat protein